MKERRWWALGLLMLPTITVMIAVSALGFAVPALSADLRPTGEQLLWIVDVYPLALAGFLIPAGLLGDRFGRRRILVLGTVLFTVASVLAAFSPTASHLIAARAVMGVFGACLMPSTMSLLTTVFGDPRERRLAIAIWTSGFSGGGAVGPIVGGWVLAHWWWGAIFLLPLALTVVFLAGVYLVVPESRSDHGEPVDPLSTALLILFLAPLAFGVKRLATSDGSAPGLLALLVGAACGVWFVRRQLRMETPMLDLRLFSDRIITMSVVANFAAVFVFVGVQFFLAQHLQLVTGLSPAEAGWWMVPGALASVVMGIGVVYIARVVSRWLLVGIGLAGTALGAGAAMLLRVDDSLALPVTMFVVMGLASAMTTTLNTDSLMAAAPPDRAGAASGVSETAFELGTAMGIALLGSVVTVVYGRSLALPGLPPDQADAASQTLGAARDIARQVGGDHGAAVLSSAQAAFVRGENIAGAVACVLLLAVAVVVARSHRLAGLGRG